MGKSKDIGQDLRQRIVELHNEGFGYRKISAALSVPISSIGTIIRKWKTHKTTLSMPRTGRPLKITEGATRKFVRTLNQKPRTTLHELQNYLNVSGIEVRSHTIGS